MRKYDIKNKKYIGIIMGIALIIIIIFSLFIKHVIDVGKIEYNIDSDSVVFDNDKNMITTTEESIIKQKWSGNYYMIYKDDMINLGSHSVIYNLATGNTSLYGTFYEVLNNEDVKVLEDENIIDSSVKSHFYKLDDRKYLIIDRTIESDDGLLVASNYLIIDIDKSGNATLLNNEINLKTFQPIILKTSAFTFDVANELLNFGNEDIDLKEIIGTTNEYNKRKKKGNNDSNSDNKDNKNGVTGAEDTSIGGNNTGNANTTSQYTGETFNRGVSNAAVREIINSTKNTSVIRVSAGLSSISVDYVIYDPSNQYQDVYVEIVEANNTDNKSTVSLSKNDTNLTISDLSYDTLYYLYFRYTYYNDSNELTETTFDSIDVSTKTPSISLTVTKVTQDKIYYKVDLDNYYNIVGGRITLYVKNEGISNNEIPSGLGSTDSFSSTIDISGVRIETGDTVTLLLDSMRINLENQFNPNVSFKFVY